MEAPATSPGPGQHDIDHNPGEERKKRYDFLVEWKLRQGADATYKALAAALERIGCVADAEYVRQLELNTLPTQTAAADTAGRLL